MNIGAKKPPAKPSKVAILNLGLHSYVMEVDDVLAVVKLMKNAELVRQDFGEPGQRYNRVGRDFELAVQAVAVSWVA